MKVTKIWMLPGIAALGIAAVVGAADGRTEASAAAALQHATDPRATRLAEAYDRWRLERGDQLGGDETRVGVGWFRGISATHSAARGSATVDLASGRVDVDVRGIERAALTDVWLIDHRPGGTSGAMPDTADAFRLVGTLERNGDRSSLSVELGEDAFRDFDVDQIVVALGGRGPIDGGVLYGSPSLFDRLHRVSRRIERGWAPIAGAPRGSGMLASFPGTNVETQRSPEALVLFESLLREGEGLFNDEDFNGNGRTCATCHPAENNFTIDREFIATLADDDPLFVAEFMDELNHDLNGGLFFENPVLLREHGLIVVNADGFDDLTQQYVLRSVNHIFALARTMSPAATNCVEDLPTHALGWAGDGSTGGGSLREFAIGAIIQHNTRSMARLQNIDFRLPLETELDALEAFQLSLGRRGEARLSLMNFTNPDVIAGRDLFNSEQAQCSVCHENAGAMRRIPGAVRNSNFDIGIFNVPHPADGLGETMPFDDGFGSDPIHPHCANTFNTPSLIEAADTAPFEHDNTFETLEEAIAHYATDAFNEQSSAGRSLTGDIELSEDEVNQLGALLRVLNALQNVDEARRCGQRASAGGLPRSDRVLPVCIADTQDAIDVLTEGPLGELHPVAVSFLEASLVLLLEASAAETIEERDAALVAAAQELATVRVDMVD